MVVVRFSSPLAHDHAIDVAPGSLLLEVALDAGIAGIVGDCGGELSCGTCHVYVDEAFAGVLPEPSADERAMIADGVIDPRVNSRLCCQIRLTPELDGLRVTAADNG